MKIGDGEGPCCWWWWAFGVLECWGAGGGVSAKGEARGTRDHLVPPQSQVPNVTLCEAAAEMDRRRLATYGRSVSVDQIPADRQSGNGTHRRGPLLGAGELIMSKSLSTSNLDDMAQESEAVWYYDEASDEERIRIELEGDGTLGLSFATNFANDVVVHHLRRGTACSEFPDLELGLILRGINGSTGVVDSGYQCAVDAVAASWAASNEVTLLLARPRAATVASLQTASGPPSLARPVRQRAPSPLLSIDCMSPIHEPQSMDGTAQSTGGPREVALPSALDLGAAAVPEPEPQAAPAAETKKQRNLRQVEEFLRELKVEDKMSAFVEFGVSSMEDLSFIEPTDLPGFGLKPLQQRRVMTALSRLTTAC